MLLLLSLLLLLFIIVATVDVVVVAAVIVVAAGAVTVVVAPVAIVVVASAVVLLYSLLVIAPYSKLIVNYQMCSCARQVKLASLPKITFNEEYKEHKVELKTQSGVRHQVLAKQCNFVYFLLI